MKDALEGQLHQQYFVSTGTYIGVLVHKEMKRN